MKKTNVLCVLIVLVVFAAACNTSPNKLEPVPVDPRPFRDLTATELVAEMRVGWSLGNTLDASGLDWLGPYANVFELETGWGNPITKKANFDALKNAGFNSVRIPVSWAKCVDEKFNIRPDWMIRVKEVVDYAVDNDMYVILNTHHDEHLFRFRDSEAEGGKKAFKAIWEQIADFFKNYDEKLVFEGLNEPRTPGSQNEWGGGTPEERKNLNDYYQIFVDVVRASGSNNEKRILLLNTYGASGGLSAMNGLVIPNDTVPNKIAAGYHAYAPHRFALDKNNLFNTWSKSNVNDVNAITSPIDSFYAHFVEKGIPVIIGEFGAMNKENVADRSAWAEFYVSYAKSKGMPCFWWDNGVVSGSGERFGLIHRRSNQFTYPEIVDALMRGSQTE